MGPRRLRLPVAIAVAVVAAGAATLLLRPRSGVIDSAPVELTAYFSAEELDRAEDFRGPQRALGLGGLALSGGVLLLIALRPPPAVRRALVAASARPLLGGAAAGAALSLALVVVTLPLDAVRHERAVDVGLSTQDWGEWLVDVGKSAAVGAVITGGGLTLLLALIRRFPRNWWLPTSAAVVALSAGFVYVSPVVIEPIFNKFTPRPPGQLRSEVLGRADRAGVDVGEVYRVDASRRTTGANAYVGGLGTTKRVVLYDNLIEDFPPEQVRSVVAHELAHVKNRDVPRGLLWLAIVAPAGMVVVQLLTERLAARSGGRPRLRQVYTRSPLLSSSPPGGAAGLPTMLPALALSLAVVSFAGAVAGNVLSRRVEARADAFALEVTRDPKAFIALERRLSLRNVGDPDPPKLLHLLFGTHPETIERIGYGVAYERAQR
jgi:STE24 endopeptidase